MVMRLASLTEDSREGTDVWIGSTPVAFRERNVSLGKYGDISIRYKTLGGKCEYDKIMDGTFKAVLYLFKFTDGIVACSVSDIRKLLQQGRFQVIPNKADGTSGAYIKIASLPQAVVIKGNVDTPQP